MLFSLCITHQQYDTGAPWVKIFAGYIQHSGIHDLGNADEHRFDLLSAVALIDVADVGGSFFLVGSDCKIV